MPASAQSAPAAVVHALYGETMSTRWRVQLCAPPRAPLEALHAAVQACLDGVVAQMSTWERDSEISRYNRAEAGTWHVLPDAFFTVLRCALEVAEASDGAYDPTVAPLVALWGFGADGAGRHRVPDDHAIVAARARTGWQRVSIDIAARRALQPGGIALDLSAIAKGHAVDAVADVLRTHGIDAALVDVGGELVGYGRKPNGAPWHVLVEASHTDDGEDDEIEPCIVVLDGRATATSGDRWHRFDVDGQRYPHTIDPRSGRPVTHDTAAVTVIADDAMRADAWATALSVLGADTGHAFAQSRDMAARFVSCGEAGAVVRMTSAFEAFLA